MGTEGLKGERADGCKGNISLQEAGTAQAINKEETNGLK